MKLGQKDDIRKHLKDIKNAELTLYLERIPFKFSPKEGTVDNYGLVYILKTQSNNGHIPIYEDIATLRTCNISSSILKKGEIEDNVNLIEPITSKKLWAQIGYRINFLKERNIPFKIYFLDKQEIDLTKELPNLPYKDKILLTLEEIMKYAKEEFIDYEREFSSWDNDDFIENFKESS